jgi:predicted GNAT superfamily acetyltransferase
MDYQELSKLTVVKLREMAQEYSDIVGATGMDKDTLVDILCAKLGVEKPHVVVALEIDKGQIKAEIRKLKAERDRAIEGKDPATLKHVRRMIHKRRHELRKATRVVK